MSWDENGLAGQPLLLTVVFSLWPKSPSIFALLEDFSRKKIHKYLVSGGYEGGKHGNLKILQVFC